MHNKLKDGTPISMEVYIGPDGLEVRPEKSSKWANEIGLGIVRARLYWLSLLSNGPEGDEIVEHIYDVQESEVKYAAARLVQLAQAKGIEVYSVEVCYSGQKCWIREK